MARYLYKNRIAYEIEKQTRPAEYGGAHIEVYFVFYQGCRYRTYYHAWWRKINEHDLMVLRVKG